MDELTEKEIEEYLSDLPVSVLEIIQDKTWKKRVSEISAKYSISEEQDTILRNLVLFVVIGVEEPETFKDSIKNELAISDLLAEQIVGEIDERVFQYIFNQISQKPEEVEVKREEPSIRMKDEKGLDNLRTMQGDIKSFKEPEQKTEERVEVISTPTHEVVGGPTKSVGLDNEFIPSKDNEYVPVMKGSSFIPENLPGMEIEQKKTEIHHDEPPRNEEIQKPIDVPRFTASPDALKKETEPEQKPSFSSVAESKLNGTTSSQKEPPSKYTIDPYREPLE